MIQKLLGISAHISPILQLSQIAMLLANNYAIFFHCFNPDEFKVVLKSGGDFIMCLEEADFDSLLPCIPTPLPPLVTLTAEIATRCTLTQVLQMQMALLLSYIFVPSSCPSMSYYVPYIVS